MAALSSPEEPSVGFSLRKLSATVGAEIRGIDLSEEMSSSTLDAIRSAWHDHHVLVFRDQSFGDNVAAHKRFAQSLGHPLEIHPIVSGLSDEFPEVTRIVKAANTRTRFGEVWHSDNSFQPQPSLGSILAAVRVPPWGNDTLFANAAAAYEALSPQMRGTLEGLRAVHTAARAYSNDGARAANFDKAPAGASMKYQESQALHAEVSHPIVRTHLPTGRKALFVNSMFTIRIDGWTEAESRGLLEYLFDHCSKPEFTCRVAWEPGSVALWDNRVLQHIAIADNDSHERVMHRITLGGEVPI